MQLHQPTNATISRNTTNNSEELIDVSTERCKNAPSREGPCLANDVLDISCGDSVDSFSDFDIKIGSK